MKKFLKYKSQIIGLVICFIFSGCASTQMLNSKFSNEPIVIDGLQNDWDESLEFIKEEKISIGFRNDSQNLYMAFVFSERSTILKALSKGLTIWMEPMNGGKIIGIKYPIKQVDNHVMPEMRSRDKALGAEQFSQIIRKLIDVQTEISVVNEDGFSLSAFNVITNQGFDAALNYAMGRLVYELKVPLEGNGISPIVFNSNSGDDIKIIIESGQFDKSEINRAGGRGGNKSPVGGSAGAGGRRQRGAGGLGMAKPDGIKNMDTQFKYSVIIHLSNE